MDAESIHPLPGRRIRWGILGYARIARECIIPAILRSENSEFHAIASGNRSNLDECRSRFQPAKSFDRYEELFRDPDVEAVYIPLPNSLHCEWTIRAAEHGKHVLCEKPLALDAAEARRMADACSAHGVILMEAFMYRYTERTRTVLDVIRSGVLGDIRFIQSTFRFLLSNPSSIRLKPELGGGSLYDVGCYPLNFSGMIADELVRAGSLSPDHAVPDHVTAECVRAGGVDMIFSALLHYPSGLIASLNSGFNAQKRIFSEIAGTKGVLEVPDTFLDNSGSLKLTVGEESRLIPVGQSDRYLLEVEDFASAVSNKRAPELRLAETLRNMEILDRLRVAAR
jgi:predicted dehydrogenase